MRFLSVHVQDVLRVVLPDIRGQAYIDKCMQSSACHLLKHIHFEGMCDIVCLCTISSCTAVNPM